MVVAAASGSLVSPSFRPQGCRRPLGLPDRPSGLRYRGQRTPLPLLCAAYTLDPLGGDEPVDVIGIGSRKDSIIDFCLASPAVSASRFRFWTIYSRDKKKVQLLERCRSKDVVIRNVEFPLSPYSCQPAAILVASAGHGLDHIAAVDLLSNIKSVGGLAIAIVLMPFSFEGQRRQKEVNDLVNRLKSCSNFYTVVEEDSFFKAEMGTLAEALESANNTALLAMNTISRMIFKMHLKILNTPEGKVKVVKPSEVVKILESYGEVKIYHGAGYSVNAAITQAILHCPFYDTGLKDFNGLTIMTLTSACNIGESDLPQIIPSFRRITGYTGEIIFSKICEPNLEPKLVVATLLIMGYNEKMVAQNKGLLCGLLQSLPFFFHFFQVDSLEASGTSSNSSLGDRFLSSDSGSTTVLDSTKVSYPFDRFPNQAAIPDKLESVLLRKDSCHETIGRAAEPAEANHASSALLRKDSCHETIGRAAEPAEANHASLSKYRGQNSGEELGIKMAEHSSLDIGPAFHIAQLWAKKCSASRTKKTDKLDTFSLPVGVKSSKLSPDCTSYSNHMLAENSDYTDQEISGGIAADMCKKDSLLSVRAAMMLEAERESLKSWNPVVEIQYRGGIYRGKCQGGLPDGKGRLTSMDGSFYDGFWKCGKRSGLGTFCYSNGDLFRGPWRDDLMHGKGWFYFHTGDRWFANFGRGKANGEGRFFSKNGSVFFGFFRDGWRHGQSVCIDVDGSRWTELWDDGVLINRTPLDKEANI